MQRHDNISASHRTIGFLLRRVYDELAGRVYQRLATVGFADIRPAYSAVLRHIDANGTHVSLLAERARMTKQSMAYLVEALTTLGYTTTSADPLDRRARLVSLTSRGHAVWHELVNSSRQTEAEFAHLLDPGEMTSLRALLSRLVERLDNEAIH